jgi:hypothetical protein
MMRVMWVGRAGGSKASSLTRSIAMAGGPSPRIRCREVVGLVSGYESVHGERFGGAT